MVERYGFLTVLDTFKGSDRPWDVRCRCRCDCGNETVVLRSNLRSGKTKSCGCMSSKMKSDANRKKNKFIVNGQKAVGITTNTGAEFIIDVEDLPFVMDVSWYESSNGYIVHKEPGKPIQSLHRLVMGNPNGMVIDHINHDVKDNRRCNLRVCSQMDNMHNPLSEPKGITEVKRKQRRYYIVQLHGYRGCFKNYDDAKRLRDRIIRDEYGRNYL